MTHNVSLLKTSVLFASNIIFYNLVRKFTHLNNQYLSEISRQQLQISTLEDKITLDNPVCFIKAFVDCMSLEALGFRM